MDQTQMEQMLTWLDEEHRRDKAEIAVLHQRLENQAAESVEQERRIEDLEGRLARVQSQLTKFSQIEQALEQTKNELVLLIRQNEEQHQQAEREATQMRQLDRDSLNKTINELRLSLQKLPSIMAQLESLRSEDRRLNDNILAWQGKLDDFEKRSSSLGQSIPYIEEQRRQDSKRIAQVQQEMIEVSQRMETQIGKLRLLEEQVLKNESGVNKLRALEDDLKRDQAELIETQKLSSQRREAQFKGWEEELQTQRQDFEQFRVQLQKFSEQYEASKRTIAELSEFQEAIQREQNQVAQMQKIAEDRQRHALEEWQEDNERQWNKHLLEWKHHLSEQENMHGEHIQRAIDLEQAQKKDVDNLEQLRRQVEQERQQYLKTFNEIWRALRDRTHREIAEMQAWVEELEEHAKAV